MIQLDRRLHPLCISLQIASNQLEARSFEGLSVLGRTFPTFFGIDPCRRTAELLHQVCALLTEQVQSKLEAIAEARSISVEHERTNSAVCCISSFQTSPPLCGREGRGMGELAKAPSRDRGDGVVAIPPPPEYNVCCDRASSSRRSIHDTRESTPSRAA